MKILRAKILIPVALITAVIAATAVFAIASPGGEDDPLITLSYINDKVIPQLKEYIDEKLSSQPQGGTTVNQTSAGFTLVNVKANCKIIGAEGTEFVLRMGSGTIVATANGGVADLTGGVDLADGSDIPSNHNLLSPKNDSRGLHMATDGIVLIKGTYTVIPD